MIPLSKSETNTLSPYDIALSKISDSERLTSAAIPFRTGKIAALGLALTSSLYLIDVLPAQQVDRDTAKSIIEPYTKDQLLDVQRQDIKMRTKVRKLASYQRGWDGFEGIAPAKEAIGEAESFISMITKNQILEPYISLAADGEINFYWKNDDFLLDVGFFGEGVYSLYAKMTSGKEIIKDDLKLTAPLLEDVASLIRE